MAAPPASAVFGATGLTGGYFLSALLAMDSFGTVHTIARRAPAQAAAHPPKLDAIVEPDTAKWPARLEALSQGTPPVSLVFSSVGTTRAMAGGIANQWKIDHDLNIDIAKAAKAAGASTFIFMSSAGTRAPLSRMAPYSRMKNGVEDAITALAFDQTIILHPGAIIGTREAGKERGVEGVLQSVANGLGWVNSGIRDAIAQDADVIGRAAAHAALLAVQGKAPASHWVLEAKDIVRLGRDEWKF